MKKEIIPNLGPDASFPGESLDLPLPTETIDTRNGSIYVVDGSAGRSDAGGSGKQTREVSLMLTPFSDEIPKTTREKLRAGLTAAATGGLAMIIDNPGVSIDHPRMSESIKKDLAKGNMNSLAEVHWEMILRGLDEVEANTPDIKRIFTASMASHIMAGLLANTPSDAGLCLGAMHFWEPAPLKGLVKTAWTYLSRGSKEIRDARESYPEWLKEWRWFTDNIGKIEELDKPMSELFRQAVYRPEGLFYYPYAMTRKNWSIMEALERAMDNNAISRETVATVIDGNNGKISDSKENNKFAQRLKGGLGLSAVNRVVLDGGTHASGDYPGAYLTILSRQLRAEDVRLAS